MSIYNSTINIPAYDASNNGLMIDLKLSVVTDSLFEIKSSGTVANALERNFRRTIGIMTSIKRSWTCLASNSYQLESTCDQFVVKDSKSSSMALSIALVNIYRAMNGKHQIEGLSGTGILRADGSLEGAHLEEQKYLAAKHSMPSLKKFITPRECNHLYDLETLINNHH